MYNREKIIQTLRDIKQESVPIGPYVVIAQPRRDKKEIPAQTFQSYGVNHVDLIGYSSGFIDVCGEKVDVARNYLIDRVLEETNAKYLFFIGDDTVVPYNAFKKLHKTAQENPRSVVVGVYYLKCSDPMIMVRTKDNHIIPADVTPGQVIETWQSGMDCMLIPVDLLREMKEKEPDLPWCCVANGIEDIPFVGEDNFFVHRLRKHNIKLLTDTSVQCLHMDNATGKYTAHPSVDLREYYTNITPTEPLTIADKAYIDKRWTDRLPKGSGPTDSWLPAEDLPKLIKDIANPVGLEIGTERGTSTEYLLETIPTLKLYGVDPYVDYIDWYGGVASKKNEEYQEFKNRISKYSDRFYLYRETSDQALKRFDDETLDFVFIDGLHVYDHVLKDCENYYSKVKSGGILCGHDFNKIEDVNRAVHVFAGKIGKEVRLAKQDMWYIIK